VNADELLHEHDKAIALHVLSMMRELRRLRETIARRQWDDTDFAFDRVLNVAVQMLDSLR
jgi:hypothetical protein